MINFATPSSKSRLVVADDQSLIRDALRALIDQRLGDSVTIVGEAENGAEAIKIAVAQKADLLLLDLSMPIMNGFDVIESLRIRHLPIKVIALTSSENEDEIERCLNAGVDGYVFKKSSQDEFFDAIKTVLSGGTYFCTGTSGKILGAAEKPQSEQDREYRKSAALTARERQVLKLVAEGKKSAEISHLLAISIKTIEKHRANLRSKLEVQTTAGLVAYALREGLAD